MSEQKKTIQKHIESFLGEMITIRHDLHMYPELGFNEHRTSGKVAELLEQWGFDVTRNIGQTGVVASLKNGTSNKSIGIRADMDALPIEEQSNVDYTSKNNGLMHACGHDGHTTILLTAARYLSETRNFDGTIHLIFQPAEEGYAGAQAMIEDGLFEKFPCDAVFGLHNWPGSPVGHMTFLKGPMMASVDTAYITIEGRGGHGAIPEKTIDPIVAASSIVMALQTIVSRNVSPLNSTIITVGKFVGGHVSNVIPDSVELELTIRAFSAEDRALLAERICALVEAQASSFGARANINYEYGYPVLINDDQQTEFATTVAQNLWGDDKVTAKGNPVTPSEDFAFMLEKRPGTYIFLGNGDSAGLHNPHYVFNDRLLEIGATYWGELVETYLKKA
ncbi:M20 aminoacylase family protein [Bartonella sp. HY761]|uniref:M20 aminoacylase family protein n=1 Tax=Bartonella sp. HY761 TaxID=2979330 RepID=UPI0021FFE0D7|nr:M20 aminoacylase family protein [Bartonella sp. HY761]UXN06049.1 M20 family metallopeptidase [Bartonella sp. HY761]